jgi:hypothetical protein
VLGIGGFATVFRGMINKNKGEFFASETRAAIKVLNDHQGDGASLALSEFLHEVTLQGALEHPNIVSILGIIIIFL